jgi:Zn-dependent protease with chaperone function
MSVPAAVTPSGLPESAEMLRRLATTAHVAVRGLEVRAKSPRLARVERRRDGFWIVFQPSLLVAPEPVRLFVLAHEVAHIALGHRANIRRLGFVVVAAIPLMGIGFFLVLASQVVNETNSWLLVIESVIFIATMLSPRAVILSVARRYEYQADHLAVTLLGSSDPGVAFFDWIAAFGRPVLMPLPLRLWGSTHPFNVERRRALMGVGR